MTGCDSVRVTLSQFAIFSCNVFLLNSEDWRKFSPRLFVIHRSLPVKKIISSVPMSKLKSKASVYIVLTYLEQEALNVKGLPNCNGIQKICIL